MRSLLGLSLAAIAAVVVNQAIVAGVMFRMGIRPLAYWLVGWAALLCGGAMTLLTAELPQFAAFGPFFGSLVAPFMLLGASAHSGRDEPTWLIPASIVVGALRSTVVSFGSPELSSSIAMATEPMLAATAAWMILHPRREQPPQRMRTDRILAIGFLVFGAVEFFDASSRAGSAYGFVNWIVWIGVGILLATTQIVVHLDRFGRKARKDEDAARIGELRFQALAESSTDFLAEFDERGLLTFASLGAIAAAGSAQPDLLGRNVSEFLFPDNALRLTLALRENGLITAADVTAEPTSLQRALLPDGSVRWFEFNLACYETPERALRILARMRDVTERTNQESRLQNSEARLRRAEQIANLGSWEFDLKSNTPICSENFFTMHGLPVLNSKDGIEQFLRLVHPDDRAMAFSIVKSFTTLARPLDNTYRILRESDGEIRTLRTIAEVDVDADGVPTRVLGATFDMTDQLELMNRLRKGQERYQSLIDSSIVIVFVAERDGFIREANDTFLALLGYSRQDLPLDWRTLTAPEYRELDERRSVEAGVRALDRPYEKEFIARDGRRVPVLLSDSLLSPDSAILIGIEISERKRAERDRADHARELEKTVAVRTRELLESRARLLESERLAVVGTLAAGVAHQINNPIGAILNCAEYALLCRSDSDYGAICERALVDNLAEARRCAQIVRSMLQFSRDQPTAKWLEDLNRVARRAQRAISAYAKDRFATITFATESEGLLARISPIEMEQAIVNVLRNAIESRPQHTQVELRLTRRDKWATIEITDDGRGIPPENQEHLFEPFFSTRTREGGTGLGLSVAHGVMRDHGGLIRIESIVDTGTRVVMTLPLEQPPQSLDLADLRGD